MSQAILIIGESGTGKSTSIRTLPPAETFIINVANKPLPFRGHRKKYIRMSPDGKEGNQIATDSHSKIMRILQHVNEKRPEIKYLILDDFGFTISGDFMRKASQRGYDKFTEIGSNTWQIIDLIQSLRDDLFVFVTMHTDIDAHGKSKPKTVGKMIDQYVVLEGRFTYVFHSIITDSGYFFLTNNDGIHMAKSPMDMFPMKIENDLLMIVEMINEYENTDEEETHDETL